MRIGSAQHGVTLIEMLVGIAILAILMAVGLPGYTAWIQNTQIRTAAESVLNGMQLARNEAVRQNRNVQLKLGTQSSWAVCLPPDPCPPDLPALPIQSRDYGAGSKNVTVVADPADATTITFSSLGRVVANVPPSPSAPIKQLDFDVPTSILAATASRNLRILVSAGGNVRMCDPDPAVTSSDPRYCLP